MAEDEEALLVDRMCVCPLEELASSKWLAHHQAVVQLSLRAVSQTAQLREETVYARLMEANKVPLLVYDIIATEVWREQVLPHLLKEDPCLSPIMVYTVMYHEGAAVSLLELLVYHSAACEAIGDSIVDLIDYCHRTLANVSSSPSGTSPIARHELLKHLDIAHLEASIAIRCISVLRYLACHADHLSESVTSRMLSTADVPLLVVRLMEQKPWVRRLSDTDDDDDDGGGGAYELYDAGQWRKCTRYEASGVSAPIHPVAAHLWLLVLALLTSPAAPRKYDLDEHRCHQLLKLRSFINSRLVDQIPPIGDFERWLVQLSVSGPQPAFWQSAPGYNKKQSKAFVLELVAGVREHVARHLADNRKMIVDRQRLLLADESPETMSRLAVIYDPEHLESTLNDCSASSSAASGGVSQPKPAGSSGGPTLCAVCLKEAVHRCSRCRLRHYCSKECQVSDWPRHKTNCKSVIQGAGHRRGGRLNI